MRSLIHIPLSNSVHNFMLYIVRASSPRGPDSPTIYNNSHAASRLWHINRKMSKGNMLPDKSCSDSIQLHFLYHKDILIAYTKQFALYSITKKSNYAGRPDACGC